MKAEQGSNHSILDIEWPSVASQGDIEQVRNYACEGFTVDESVAHVIIDEAGRIGEECLERLSERVGGTPERFGFLGNYLGLIITEYTFPATHVLKAREIERKGPEMPILLNEEFSAVLRTLTPMTPGTTIEGIEAMIIEGNLRKYQDQVRMVGILQSQGPLGVVDFYTDQALRVLSPHSGIGKKMRAGVEHGRNRFHRLYSAMQSP